MASALARSSLPSVHAASGSHMSHAYYVRQNLKCIHLINQLSTIGAQPQRGPGGAGWCGSWSRHRRRHGRAAAAATVI